MNLKKKRKKKKKERKEKKNGKSLSMQRKEFDFIYRVIEHMTFIVA